MSHNTCHIYIHISYNKYNYYGTILYYQVMTASKIAMQIAYLFTLSRTVLILTVCPALVVYSIKLSKYTCSMNLIFVFHSNLKSDIEI